MKNKCFIKTFGCQMNFNDSVKICNILKENNYNVVSVIEQADIIIINTCSVRESSYKNLYKFFKKLIINKFLIILTGCFSSHLSKYILKKFDFIDIILGPQNIYFINKLIFMYYFYNCKQINISFLKSYNYNYYNKKLLDYNNCNIIITEGCNKFCSYCIVPYVRGIEISLYLDLILNKIFKLNSLINNYITLIGQNVTSYYGKIKLNSNKFISFFNLLNYIIQFKFIRNINFITSHPSDFCNDIINIYKINFKLSKFLHLPLQSCSNKILFYMKRNYKLSIYKLILDKLKIILNKFSISTDIMIGFCYENKCDFYKTLVFVEKFLFDKSYIFIYNPRPYTKSYYYLNNIDNFIKIRRFILIQNKIKNNIFYINKLLILKIEFIIVKGYCFYSNNLFFGFTFNNRLVYFFYYFSFKFFIIKKILKLKILKTLNNGFFGLLLF